MGNLLLGAQTLPRASIMRTRPLKEVGTTTAQTSFLVASSSWLKFSLQSSQAYPDSIVLSPLRLFISWKEEDSLFGPCLDQPGAATWREIFFFSFLKGEMGRVD